MNHNLSISIPRSEFELDHTIISVKKRLAFLETPTCRNIMPQEIRLTEIKGATTLFKSLLAERATLRKGCDLYE